jgi:23S rRNA (cytidine1920-2'-O)/16S rRNA (cytidine1409-2'-O)-methyltransferase
MTGKTRLDQALVDRRLCASRSRARDAVLRGAVTVNGTVVSRPAAPVSEADAISLADAASAYVSRAALKLRHALDLTGYSPTGLSALDIGASTGGFTQVLLEHGATRVFAMDVGHGQLDPGIAADPRVSNLEGLNARELEPGHFGNASIAFLVCDVSFISLTLALPPALDLAQPGARGVFLVKPQFEVGRENVGKGGIVRDAAVAEAAAERLARWLDSQPHWISTHVFASPIEGGDGNREFLLAGEKSR